MQVNIVEKGTRLIVFLFTIFLISCPHCCAQNVLEEQGKNSVYVYIDNVNVNALNADIRLELFFWGPETGKNHSVHIYNKFSVSKNESRSGNTFGMEIYPETNLTLHEEIIGQTYHGKENINLKLFGEKQAYPYDSYMLNFTLEVPFDTLTKNNTKAYVPYSNPIHWHQRSENPEVTIKPNGETTNINFQVIIDRSSWDVSFLSYVYIPFFLFIGGLTFINPVDFSGKLGVYTSLFLTLSTSFLLFFSQYVPAKSGTTILYYLYYFILITLIMYFVWDVMIITNTMHPRYFYFAPLISAVICYSLWGSLVRIFNIYPWLRFPENLGRDIGLTLLSFSILHYYYDTTRERNHQRTLDYYLYQRGINHRDLLYLLTSVVLSSIILFLIITKL